MHKAMYVVISFSIMCHVFFSISLFKLAMFYTFYQLLLNVFQFCSVNKLQKSSLPSQKCKSYSTDTYRQAYINLAMQSPMLNLRRKYQPALFLVQLGHLIQLMLLLYHFNRGQSFAFFMFTQVLEIALYGDNYDFFTFWCSTCPGLPTRLGIYDLLRTQIFV